MVDSYDLTADLAGLRQLVLLMIVFSPSFTYAAEFYCGLMGSQESVERVRAFRHTWKYYSLCFFAACAFGVWAFGRVS